MPVSGLSLLITRRKDGLKLTKPFCESYLESCGKVVHPLRVLRGDSAVDIPVSTNYIETGNLRGSESPSMSAVL